MERKWPTSRRRSKREMSNNGEKAERAALRRKLTEKRAQFYSRPTPRGRLDAVLSDPEGELLVRSLPPVELHLFAREVDPEDKSTLVGMASVDQIQRMMDLSCWKKDLLDLEALTEWILLLRECGPETFSAALEGLDRELWILYLRHHLEIVRQGSQDVSEEDPYDFSPDDLYFFRFRCGRQLRTPLLECLEELYRQGPYFAYPVLESAQWDLESTLQEEAYRLRQGRMEEHGFPDYFEALKVYQFQDPKSGLTGEPVKPEDFPAPVEGDPIRFVPEYALVSRQARDSFLQRTLQEDISEEGRERLRWELTYLCHKVLVADQVDLGDREEISRALERTHNLLSLGLESYSAGRLPEARLLLEKNFAESIFRAEYNRIQALRSRGRALTEGGWLTQAPGLSFLDSPGEEVLLGLRERHPHFPRILDPGGKTGFREFKNAEDVELLDRELAILETLGEAIPELLDRSWRQIFALDLSRCLPDSWSDVQTSALFLTAFANAQLGRGFHLAPVPAGDLRVLYRHCREPDAALLKNQVRNRFEASLGERFARDPLRRDRVLLFARRCWRIFEEEFLAIDPHETIDPRFVRGLLIRLP